MRLFDCLMLALIVSRDQAAAQTAFPTRPVRLVVPSAPGGGIDIIARLLADHLSKAFASQFYVENRAGAGNMIGIETVARAEPDGYTLLVAASPMTINHLTYKSIGYDAVRDFAPITLVLTVPSVLVVDPRLPFDTLADLVAEAKRRPGRITFGSAGLGTNPHMSMEMLKSMTGIDLSHVAYRGVSPALIDIVGGSVACMIAPLISAKSQIDAGGVRALAVTSRDRAAALPAVPTVAEAGVPGYETLQWYGVLAPAATPGAYVDRLNRAIVAAIGADDIRKYLEVEGGTPVGNSPAEFGQFIRHEMTKWGEVAKAAKLQPAN